MDKNMKSLEIKVKYSDTQDNKLKTISNGNWIDLYTDGDYCLIKDTLTFINTGVAMKLPEGYEALMLPRSSTFKKYGLLLANSMGVIDNSYSGNDDYWLMAFYSTKPVTIYHGTRLAQFRIQKSMPDICFKEQDYLDSENRGGFGSTGD